MPFIECCLSPGWFGMEEETGSFHSNFSLLGNDLLSQCYPVFFPKGMDILLTVLTHCQMHICSLLNLKGVPDIIKEQSSD